LGCVIVGRLGNEEDDEEAVAATSTAAPPITDGILPPLTNSPARTEVDPNPDRAGRKPIARKLALLTSIKPGGLFENRLSIYRDVRYLRTEPLS